MTEDISCDKSLALETQSQKYKKIFRRIGRFQDYLHEMCNLVSSYAVKSAGMRDKNDEVAKCITKFIKVEEFSTSSKLAMAIVGELFASVGDHQDIAVQRIETLVLPNLSSYGRICKCIKAEVLNAISAKSREMSRIKVTKTLRKRAKDPKYESVVNDAEKELTRAAAETTRLSELSLEQVIKFEHKRLMDLKESLGNFIKIQISTHAKSLELLSEAYKHIQSIDEDADLDILKYSLKIGDTVLKRKSSTSTKITSRKSSATQKPTNNNTIEDYNSSNTETWNSEVIERLEKVFNSNHEEVKQRDKSSKTQLSKDESKTSHHKKSHYSTTCTSVTESESDSSESYKEYRTTVSKNQSHNRGNSNDHIHKDRSNARITDASKKTSKHQRRESDTRISASLKEKQKATRRPTTPTRAVTVPNGISSPEEEEESSRINDSYMIGFNKNKTNRSSNDKSYYYSQSEEDRARKRASSATNAINTNFNPSQIPRAVFRENKSSRNDFVGPGKNGFSVKSAGNIGQGYAHGVSSVRKTDLLFQPVKSSLKKFC